MLTILVSSPGEPIRELEFAGLPLRIGRHRDCEVRLGGWRVAPVHARLQQSPSGLRIMDAGTLQGFRVNGERGPEFPITDENDEIEIAGYRLRVRPSANRLAPVPPESERQTVAGPIAAPRSPVEAGPAAEVSVVSEAHLVRRRRLHQLLLRSLDLRRVEVREMASRELRERAALILNELIPSELGHAMPPLEAAALVDEVLDEALGLGPVERLLLDPEISEIMINGAQQIFVERAGRIEASPASFSSESALRNMVDRVVAPIGRRVDENSPMVDARLPDGSRLNAVLAPIAVRGTAVTIRRFSRRTLGAAELVQSGSASEAMMEYLRQAVLHRRNILISGGTGSGKTTLLNLLSGFIPLHERLITIEDAAELQLRHPHLISLEARPSNIEGRGAISIRELLRNALRMRPDRIIVGECRGTEALDMLQAMNTGHEGSLTTVHANSARDALARIETMVMLAGMDLPLAAVREQIASSVHVVVQQSRDAAGGRRITEISEVAGIEGSRILMQTLFRWSNGRFESQGVLPLLNEVIDRKGRMSHDPDTAGVGHA